MKGTRRYIQGGLAVCMLSLAQGCSDSHSTGKDLSSSTDDDMMSDGGVRAADSESLIPDTITVIGPVEGGTGMIFTATAADLETAGYSEKEFFFAGGASMYIAEGQMGTDGKWVLGEEKRAAFRSRLLVRRPNDGDKFNGSVVVEWLNVSGGADGDPGFMYNSAEILREGYAYVGVTAQSVGVEGGGFGALLGGGNGPKPLKQHDPERYGSLVHPGDDYSYDIFSQAARVLRGEGGVDVLEGLVPERLLAYGESQSAGRMVSYVNGVHPLDRVYDGFFIHSRGGAGVPFADPNDLLAVFTSFGAAHRIRDDLEAPVFQFQTEGDVAGFLAARQDDSDTLRTWEVAGTAHADQFILDFNASNPAATESGVTTCDMANDGPQVYVIRAALHHLDQWVRRGTPPPKGDPIEMNSSGQPVTDEFGNARGGVRTPDVDVPVATHTGVASSGSGGWCFLFGSTIPFAAERIQELYASHKDYVEQVKASEEAAVVDGFLLAPEGKAMLAKAKALDFPE